MFSTESAQAAIVDCVDPLSQSLKRSHKESSLETETLPYQNNITRREVRNAFNGWTDALVDISQTYKNDGFEAAKELTEAVIDGGYAYQIGPVAFKPTWANGDQTFRTTRKGAVSYFVGGDEDYDDLGFAIGSAPDPVTGERSAWKDSWFDLSVRRFDGETAIVQGLLYTEAEDGTVGYVDKTWGFQKDDLGNVRIVLHHSSSPYETIDEPKKIKNHTVNNRSFDIDNLITKKEVLAAQEGWTDALVAISQTYKDEGFDAAEELAGAVIDAAYGYQEGAVAFKPTWAYGDSTFRPTREGAVSYFVGGNDKYDDLGFAIGSTPDENGDRSSWADAWTENAVIRIDGDTATTMGWMYTEDEAGNVGYVDKTWTFQKGDDGVLRVVVHHSSKPYE